MPAASVAGSLGSLGSIFVAGSANGANQARAAGQTVHIDHSFIDVTFEAVIEGPIPDECSPVAALAGPKEG